MRFLSARATCCETREESERGSACTRGAPRAVMRDQLEEALNHQACPEILGGE